MAGPSIQDATLKATHVEQQVGVILTVHRHKAGLPLHSGDGARQSVLHIPEHRTPQVHVMFHEAHASISRPALSVVIANYVLIVRVRVLSQVALDQVPSLLCCEPEEHVDLVYVARVQAYRVRGLSLHVLEGEEVIGQLRRSCHLTSSL